MPLVRTRSNISAGSGASSSSTQLPLEASSASVGSGTTVSWLPPTSTLFNEVLDEAPSDEEREEEESGAEWLHSYKVWSKKPVQTGMKPERVVIIVNLKSGRRQASKALDEARQLFERQGVAVRAAMTQVPGDALRFAHQAEERAICVVGGAGTLNDVVNGIMRRPDKDSVTLGIIPGGGPQNLACDMGIRTAQEGANRVIYGQVRRIDVLAVESDCGGGPSCEDLLAHDSSEDVADADPGTPQVIYAMNMVGWGFASAVCKDADRFRFLGRPCYNLGAYTQLVANRSYVASIEVPECEVDEETRLRLYTPNEYTMLSMHANVHMSKQVPFCPHAQLDDGLMDVITMPKQNRASVIRRMEDADTAKHVDVSKPCPQRLVDNGDYIQVSQLILRPTAEVGRRARLSAGPRTVNVDGDVTAGTPFRVTVVPLALRVFA